MSFRPSVDIDGIATRVVVDQMTAVDHSVRLGEFAGRLSTGELLAVEDAVRVVFGLR